MSVYRIKEGSKCHKYSVSLATIKAAVALLILLVSTSNSCWTVYHITPSILASRVLLQGVLFSTSAAGEEDIVRK